MAMNTRRSKLVAVAVVVAFALGFIFTITRGERSRDLVLSLEPVDSSSEVTVYVGGAVDEPGLYSLPRGARLSEAIDLAGRLESANVDALDLAAVLHDEQTVVVPETAPERESGADSDAPASTGAANLIDVNTASADELELLTGIGTVLAERIIERRESAGPFTSLDELTEVNGISERMVDDLRDDATAR